MAILLGIAAVGAAQASAPRTVLDYFMLLPQSYFAIESCDTYKIRNCRPYKNEYLKRFLEIEDLKNGFLSGGRDGSQEDFEMALFKRPDRTYLVGLHVFGEWGDTYRFLSYRNNRWTDVSRTVIPSYRRSHIYKLPRVGTTVAVFERRNFDAENNQGEEGPKLYDLVWKEGAFFKKK
jgi:hypothetical protein